MPSERWKGSYDDWLTNAPEMPSHDPRRNEHAKYHCTTPGCHWKGWDGLTHHRAPFGRLLADPAKHHRIVRNGMTEAQKFGCCVPRADQPQPRMQKPGPVEVIR